MKIRTGSQGRLWAAAIFFFAGFMGLWGQSSSADIINIAIPDLTVLTGMEDGEAQLISSEIRSFIEGSGVFNVVERNQLDKVVEAKNSNVVTGRAEETLALEGVDQLLYGTIGKLYGKIVITLKLTDLATGTVLFSTNSNFPQEDVHREAERLVADLTRKASYRLREITPEDIITANRRGEYLKVKDLLDVYRSQNDNFINEDLQKIAEKLDSNLADAYLEGAEEFKDDKNFEEALRMVGLAIAIRPEERAFQLRDEIETARIVYEKEQEEYRRLQLEAEAKRSEKRLRDLATDPFESFDTYYRVLRPGGVTLGADMMWFMDENYSLPHEMGSVGIFCRAQRALNQDDDKRGYFEVNHLGSIEMAVHYRTSGTEPSGYFTIDQNSLDLSISLSPYSSVSFKMMNLMVNTGLDLGGVLLMQNSFGGGMHMYPSLGISAEISLKVYKTMALSLRGRGEYLFDVQGMSLSNPNITGNGIRLLLGAGVTM